ncbi:MAG TPA: hypothetical protein VFQ45_17580 [Longimicrobium sp.]|nr:hypothetical protein [Longimicrobium sp.]
MELTWEAILSVAGGSALGALLLVAGGWLASRLLLREMERTAEVHRAALANAAESHKSVLAVALETHRAAVAFSAAVDTDLRERRIGHYTALWKLTSVLPKWPRDTDVAYADLHRLSARMRDWYFSGSGMFLSTESIEKYKAVQDAIAGLLGTRQAHAMNERLATPDYEHIRRLCSGLRTELTRDVVSRRASRLADPAAAPIP